MSARRKIADMLRRAARAIDDTPAERVLRLELAPRRISPATGSAEYFDRRRGLWVPWRDWLGRA